MKTNITRVLSLIIMCAISVTGILFVPSTASNTAKSKKDPKVSSETIVEKEKTTIEETTEVETTTEEPKATSVNGINIINVLLQYVDKTPYVRGGYNFESGTDCCGMISLAYAEYGVNIADDCTTMINKPAVSMEEMLPGDVIGTSVHVCIFAGWLDDTNETTLGYTIGDPVILNGGLDEAYTYPEQLYAKIDDFDINEGATAEIDAVRQYSTEIEGVRFIDVTHLADPLITWHEGQGTTFYKLNPIKGYDKLGVIIELLPGGPMAISTMAKSHWNLPDAHRICTNTATTNYFQGDLSNYNRNYKYGLLAVNW